MLKRYVSVALVLALFLCGCAPPRLGSTGLPSNTLKIHWTFFAKEPDERKDIPVLLRVADGGRSLSEASASYKAGDANQSVTLPRGGGQLSFEVAGVAVVHVAVDDKPDQSLQLWLNDKDNNRPALTYELHDESAAMFPVAPSADGGSFTLHCSFYRDDYHPGKPDAVPLQIFLDGHVCFDGIASAGVMRAATYEFQSAGGIHSFRFRVPGFAEKTYSLDVEKDLWISVHFQEGMPPFMQAIVSDDLIPVF